MVSSSPFQLRIIIDTLGFSSDIVLKRLLNYVNWITIILQAQTVVYIRYYKNAFNIIAYKYRTPVSPELIYLKVLLITRFYGMFIIGTPYRDRSKGKLYSHRKLKANSVWLTGRARNGIMTQNALTGVSGERL